MEPRRCSGCGSVVTCACATCPACGRDSLRPLTEAEHGDGTVELDALPPTVLQALIREAVEGEITDPDAWQEQADQEAQDRADLAARLG